MTTFHAGERAIQQRAGFGDTVASVGQRLIRDALPAQHQAFFAQQAFVLVGVLDADGHPRAGVLAGAPGFIAAPDARHLDVRGGVVVGEGVAGRLVASAPFGMLGIEAYTRRRNRVNGVVVEAGAGALRLGVAQSFGNCPKYIHPRRAEWTPWAGDARVSDGWDGVAQRIVAAADTFFIASAHPDASHTTVATHGVDLSHRGGAAGFVAVQGRTLRVPDYPGNRFFNTLGNLELNPRAGLLFIDHATRTLLQLAVQARIEWLPPADDAPGRPGRVLHFDVLHAQRSDGALPLTWID